MKKISKILAVLLSVCVLIAAAILVVSAEETAIDGTYAVDGTGYDSWADAVAAAGGTETIYLNEDVTVSDQYKINSKVSFDLNSHTINFTKTDKTPLFALSGAADFELIGEGKINGANRVFDVASGTKLTVNALGDGIEIKASAATDTVIYVKPGGTAYLSGDIDYTPAKLAGRFIHMGDAKSSLSEIVNSSVTVDALRLTVNEPSNDQRHARSSAMYFAYLYEGAQLTVKNNSVINMVYGNMFHIATSDTSSFNSYADEWYTGKGDNGAYATEITEAPVELTIRIDVDDSKLYANNSGYSVLKHNSYAGLFLGGAYKAFYMTMDNVDIVACNRTISGTTQRGNYNVAAGKIEFTNVNFTSSEGVAYESSWVVSEKVNIVWNGGVIECKTGKVGGVAVTIPKTADGDPFGADAIAAAKAKGVDISPEKHRVVMYDGVNYNGSNILDEWTYYTKLEGAGYNAFTNNGIGYAEYVLKADGSGYRLAEKGETPDTWFGMKISNVAFVTAPNEPNAAPTSGYPCYTIEGTKIPNVSISTGLFESEKYAVGYFVEAPKAAHNLISKYSGVYNPTTEWNKKVDPSDDTKGVQTGSRGFESIVEAVRDFGTAEHVLGGEGKNGYFKWSVAEGETAGSTADPYYEVKLGTYAGAASITYSNGVLTVTNEKSPELPTEDYKYIIHEFDIATDKGVYPTSSTALITRVSALKADSATTLKTAIDQIHYAVNGLKIAPDGTVSSGIGKNEPTVLTTTKEKIKLPTDGTWSRISFIYEFKGWEDAGTYTVNGVTRPQSKCKIDLHVYVNGVWLSTFSDFIKMIDSDFVGTFTLDATRFYSACEPGSSLLLDNPRLSYYKADDKACADIAKITADPTKAIADNPEISIMPDNNFYYDAVAVGKVDGKEYITEKELINAIEPGSVVELYKDISALLNVSANNKMILNGHKYAGYFSETHVGRQYDNVISFVAAKPSEIVTLHHKSDVFGIDDSTHKATLGSTIYLLVSSENAVPNNGVLSTLVGWQTASGKAVITEADVMGGTVELVPVTSDENYYYTVMVDGKVEYYFEDEIQNIVANVNSVLTEGKTVVVVLWSDIDVAPSNAYSLTKNSSLYFDLNGHKYMKTSGGNAFVSNAGTHFYLYSSRAGGAIVASQGLASKTTARVTGSPIWYTSWNENEEHPGMHAAFGTVKNDALGINADGKNLTVMASIIADVRCKEIAQATEANGFTDRNRDGKVDASDIKERATLTIDGGNYIRFTMGGWAMFSACGPLDLNIKNANIIGVGSHFSTNSKYHATSMNLTVDNSRVIATSNKFDGTGLEKVFNEFTDDSKASFTNTVIAGKMAPSAGTVTLGAGVALVNPDQISAKVKLADGLVMANANYSVTTSTPVNYLTYSFTCADGIKNYDFRDTWAAIDVGVAVSSAAFNKELSPWETYTDTRHIVAYIDSPENLAHITWYDIDGETVLSTTYNAPFGDYAIDPELEKSVSIAEGNEWYNVRFTRWTLPTLVAGELAVIPVCETPVANVTCLDLNITLYTNFRLNYYLPVNTDEGFSLKGISSDAEGTVLLASEIVEIDGVSYVMFTEFVSPSDVAQKARYIHFTIGETEFVQYVSFGVEDYVSEILNDDADKYTLDDKIIIANVVRYANEHYKLNVDAAGYAVYNELLDANSAKLVDTSSLNFSKEELDVDKSNLDSIVGNIGFLCEVDRPAFTVVYKNTVYQNVILPDAADGGFAAWPENNRGIFTYIHYENYVDYERELLALQVSVDMSNNFTTGAALENGAWNEADFVVAMAGDMLVEDISSVFKIVVYNPDGSVVRGTYSMAAFLKEASASNAEYNCAVSLYALSLAAQEYAAK